MCTSESLQRYGSRAQFADSSKACKKPRAFNGCVCEKASGNGLWQKWRADICNILKFDDLFVSSLYFQAKCLKILDDICTLSKTKLYLVGKPFTNIQTRWDKPGAAVDHRLSIVHICSVLLTAATNLNNSALLLITYTNRCAHLLKLMSKLRISLYLLWKKI